MMTPLGRKAFDAIERPLAAGMETWVQSDTFMDMAAITFRVQRRQRRSAGQPAAHAPGVDAGWALMAPGLLERQFLRARNGLAYLAGSNRPVMAQTPRDEMWRRDKVRLWRYRSEDRRYRPPVLIVHSLVSKSYILDLLPGASMIGLLLGEGLDVFLLDWESADPGDAENTFETYVDGYIPWPKGRRSRRWRRRCR
jgi:hypothetical protein